jgi:CTP-dependent riboflavin kinase
LAEEEISQENYANWFALYQLCRLIKNKRKITISTIKFGEILGLSQQSGSRRINALIELHWIKRKIDGKSQTISITKEGTK